MFKKIITPLPLLIDNGQSDLKLWLDASDTSSTNITQSGGSVSQWLDKSGKGYNLTQSTGSDQPTTGSSTINGLNAIDFNGTQYLENNSFASLLAGNDISFSAHFVYQPTSVSSGTIFGAGNSSSNNYYFHLNPYRPDVFKPSFNSSSGTSSPLLRQEFGTSDTSPHIVSIIKKATTLSVYFDKVKVVDNVAYDLDNMVLNIFTIGALLRISEDFNFQGNIGELIFYSRENTEEEINSLQSYLSNKWGVFSVLADLPNLSLWLDASDLSTITESTGSVSQWNDKSGNTNHATQSTGSAQPTTGSVTIGGLNTIRFTTDNFMDIPTLNFTNVTGFLVARQNSNSSSGDDSGGVTLGNTSNNYQLLRYSNISGNGRLSYYSNAIPEVFYNFGADMINVPLVVTNILDADTVYSEIRSNGSTVVTGGYAGRTMSINTLCKLFSNARPGLDIGEIILCDAVLSDDKINQVEAYLNNKWGIY